MSGPPFARIDESGVAPVGVGDRAPEAMLVGRDDDQMDVVGHQAIGPDFAAGTARSVGQEVAIQRIIGVFEERLLTAVAALGHVIGRAGDDDAREPGHASLQIRASARLAARRSDATGDRCI